MIKSLSIKIIIVFCVTLSLLVSCTTNRPSSSAPQKKDNYSTTDIDSLLAHIAYKDAHIDSLYNVIQFLNFQVDSLQTEIEVTSAKVLINDSFVMPYRFNFAGVDIDLHNDRIRSKLQQIFDAEVKSAHTYIPRSGIYFAIFDSIITANNLHPDIKYLAVAESYLNYMAYSQANAAGIWQFIPSTAKAYNLKVDNYLDERRNIFKATEAACRYIILAQNQLKGMGVDDILVALASYNSGMGNISRSIREQNAKDFFSMMMRVEETNNYVWRAIAIKMIFENETAIFEKPFYRQPPLLETNTIKTITTNGYYDLVEWAIAQGTTVQQIWELNPWLNISRTRSGRYTQINNLVIPPGNFEILIPIDSQGDSVKIATAEEKFLKKNNSPYLLGPSNQYKVKSGDTIYGLARRFGVSENDIRRWNNLSSNRIYAGQTLYFQASGSSSNNNTSKASTATPPATNTDTASGVPTTKTDAASGVPTTSGEYTVLSGDTLSQIAEKLGVPTMHLVNANNITYTTKIYPGQVLKY